MEEFNPEELTLLHETDFLMLKASSLSKVNLLLSKTREGLIETVKATDFRFPEGCNRVSGKISIGENYRGLPYQILDYPSLFTKEDTFAFRTMFWWGNFFSATLHLEGHSLDVYKNRIVNNIDHLINKEVYICVGNTPWEYHYKKDNYKLIELSDQELILNHPFIKLSRKWELTEYLELPENVENFVGKVLSVLK